MEYLSGGQLKRVFEKRLKLACIKQNMRSDSSSENDQDPLDYKNVKLKEALFSEEETAQIIKSLLKGLSPLHSMNYIHRDIKPENIVLAPLTSETDVASPTKKEQVNLDQSQLKIVDFGFSARYKVNPSEHIRTEKIGTILFMAPEQISK